MGFVKEYFPAKTEGPAPLVATCSRRVRFEEVDSVNMVWHGRFPSYLEDGRISFGDKYGLTYQAFRQHMTVAPIVQMHLDYKIPLRFDQLVEIETSLHWTEATRVNFSYIIRSEKAGIHATGYTVQLLTEVDGTILLSPPEWLLEFLEKWKSGFWSGQ